MKRPRTTGKGGLRPRLAPLAFDGEHEGRFLAADERPCADTDIEVEVESCLKDVLTEELVFPRLADRPVEPVDGEGIFRPDVYITLLGADGIRGDGHGLDDAVRIAFEDAAVHECAGVAFIGVTDDVFHVAG